MTNYNERLDDELKQAITLLIKELVAEAKPDTSGFSDEYWRVNGSKVILMFEANLLKALDEK